jgi:RNA polymerase sigma factor (sigma-70 family)
MGVGRPGKRRARRDEIDPAALGLITRHGAKVLATARRFSATLDDAEDAYQRALEILLTKAPTTNEAELVAWLKTVVKHEAFAIRRQRERQAPTTDDGELGEPAAPETPTQDQAERYERLRLGAEAMRKLKPHEVRCLLLKAEGYSYKEICSITGWSYTKVNRCMTEGRRAFLERVAGIEGGGECERLAPLVSLLADGELGADEIRMLRPHLKTCLACRARLREYRAAPARVAALFPPAAVVASGGASDGGPLRGLIETLLGATQERAAVLGERAHAATELAAGQKVAAVAASAAAIAGGGATVDRLASDERAPQHDRAAAHAAQHPQTAEQQPAPQPPVETAPAAQAPTPDPAPAPQPAPAQQPQPSPQPPPEPANEFTPGPAAAPPEPAPAATSSARPATGGGGDSSGAGSSGSGSGSGEFAP